MRYSTTFAAMAAAVMLVGGDVLPAQTTDSTRTMRPRRQMSDSTDQGRMMQRDGQHGRMMREGARHGAWQDGMGRGRQAMMRGITLSDAQQRALRTSQVRHLTEMKPLQLEMLSATADARIARLNGDQRALDAATARVTATRDKVRTLASGRSPVSELRSVLTPDQQKILDENLASMANRPAARERVGPGADRRGFAPGQGRRGFAPGRGAPGMGPRSGVAPRRIGQEGVGLGVLAVPADTVQR